MVFLSYRIQIKGIDIYNLEISSIKFQRQLNGKE